MNVVGKMHTWVQGCLDAYGSGTVQLEYCDGIPGNYSLYYLGTREVSRQVDVQKNALLRLQSHFQLRSICLDRSGQGAHRMDLLEQDMQRLCARGAGPELVNCRITTGSVKRLRADPDGTAEYAMELYAEYDVYCPWEE